MNPLVLADFYKTGHIYQYPDNTELIYSNWTARGSRIKDVNKVVVFGVQYFIKEYLIKKFNEEFFNKPKNDVVKSYKRRIDNALGKDAIRTDHIEALHDLGYMPLEIKALDEGSKCPLRVPCITIKNTIAKFSWVTNFIESIMSNIIWMPMTSATIADMYRCVLDEYAAETSDIPEFVDWQGHDFSFRGMPGLEAACLSAAAHLLSFKGTDTIPAIDFLESYYSANSDNEFIAGSVPATEHSVMSLGEKEKEIETFERLITKTYPNGIVSIVSDTWDLWEVINDFLPKLKDKIMKREGKIVIRPDSGDPVKIICGDKEAVTEHGKKGVIELLWEIFGGETNSKGYKQLDSHIGTIYGDAITIDRCKQICSQLKQKGFASTNIVYGIGSYTYQYNTRDTFGFAMKATYGVVDGVKKNIWKNPKTDDGLKASAKGLLMVDSDMNLHQEVSEDVEKTGLLKTVFIDGKIIKQTSLSEIRERVKA